MDNSITTLMIWMEDHDMKKGIFTVLSCMFILALLMLNSIDNSLAANEAHNEVSVEGSEYSFVCGERAFLLLDFDVNNTSANEKYYIQVFNDKHEILKVYSYDFPSSTGLSADFRYFENTFEPGDYLVEVSSNYGTNKTEVSLHITSNSKEECVRVSELEINAVRGDATKPYSAWDVINGTAYFAQNGGTGAYSIKLDRLVYGNMANAITCFKSEGNNSASSDEQWLLMWFEITNKGKKTISAYDIIQDDETAKLFSSTGDKIKVLDYAYGFDDAASSVEIKAGKTKTVMVGYLIDKSVGFPRIRLSTVYSNGAVYYSYIDVSPKAKSCLVNPFIDVADGKYYTESILYLNNRGVMTGFNSTVFGFGNNLLREDTVMLLWKNEGKPYYDVNKLTFLDTPKTAYYAQAIVWARENNVITGKNPTTFGKGENIIRQDFVKILYGYAKLKGYDTKVKSSKSYTEKPDYSTVSSYARESINWGYENGFIGNGSPLRPLEPISRQDAATIIARFLKKYNP